MVKEKQHKQSPDGIVMAPLHAMCMPSLPTALVLGPAPSHAAIWRSRAVITVPTVAAMHRASGRDVGAGCTETRACSNSIWRSRGTCCAVRALCVVVLREVIAVCLLMLLMLVMLLLLLMVPKLNVLQLCIRHS